MATLPQLRDLPEDIRIARIRDQKPHLVRMLQHVMAEATARQAENPPPDRTH